jgi:hypothetical protein
MREVGVLVWVAFIVIGVIANIASTARKQAAQKAPQPQALRRPAAVPVARAPVTAPPRVAAVAQPAPVRRPQPAAAPVVQRPAPLHEAMQLRRRPLFADRPSLVRAVIAAEVLGKPRALRDE